MRNFLLILLILTQFSCSCGGDDDLPIPEKPQKTLSPAAREFLQLAEDFPVVESRKKHWQPDIWVDVAKCRMLAGDTAGGLRLFRKLLTEAVGTDSKKLTAGQAKLLSMMQPPDAHREVLAALRNFSCQSARCLEELIRTNAFLRAKQHDKALPHLQKAVKIFAAMPPDDQREMKAFVSWIFITAEQLDARALFIPLADALPEDMLKNGSTAMNLGAALSEVKITAENAESATARVMTLATDDAKSAALRPILYFYITAGDVKSAFATLDRVFPPDVQDTKRAADEIAIFGLRTGRDMALESLAISLAQHGHLPEAQKAVTGMKEARRKILAIRKVGNVILGNTNDQVRTVFAGYGPGMGLSDALVGGDLPDASIPKPEFSPETLRAYCLWLRDNPPQGYTEDEKRVMLKPEQWLATTAVFMAKCGQTELARQTAAQSLEIVEEKRAAGESYRTLWEDYGHIVTVYVALGDMASVDKTLAMIESHNVKLAAELAEMPEEDRQKNWVRTAALARGIMSPEQMVLALGSLGLDRQRDAFIAGQPEDARHDLEVLAWCVEAQMLIRDGKKDAARELVRKILRQPEVVNVTVRQGLGMMLMQLKMREEHAAWEKEIRHELSPSQPNAMHLARDGKIAEAEQLLLEEARKIKHPTAHGDDNTYRSLQHLLSEFQRIHSLAPTPPDTPF